MDQRRKELLRRQYDELKQHFSKLKMFEDSPDNWAIRGILHFKATYNGITIEDEYSILISIPEKYPDTPPHVQETGGRIPPDFHQYDDRTLCLAAPAEVNKRFKKDPRLITFVKTLVIEYLYGYSFFEKHSQMPFGELSHGGPGLREYYSEIFNTDDVWIILALLKIMADGSYRGHNLCPCGSGKILRKCHGPVMLELLINQGKDRFLNDSIFIMDELSRKGLGTINPVNIPQQIKQQLGSIK